MQAEPTERAQLHSWYERAHLVSEHIQTNPELCSVVPELVWHYLSDADIRLKDKRYAKVQREALAEWIAS